MTPSDIDFLVIRYGSYSAKTADIVNKVRLEYLKAGKIEGEVYTKEKEND